MNIAKNLGTPGARPDPKGGGSPVEQLASQLASLESSFRELITCRFASLEQRLEALRELLTSRRKEHLVVDEVAHLTGRSAFTIRRWISEGKLRAIRLQDGGPRGRLLIHRSELERLVAEGRGASVPDAAVISANQGA